MRILRFGAAIPLIMSGWALAQGLPGKGLGPVSQEEIMPLVRVCESCHGPGGQTTRFDIPPLAGKSADSIVASLEQFYYYERHCPDVEYEGKDGKLMKQSMCDITNALSQQEALALASFFENQQPARDAED